MPDILDFRRVIAANRYMVIGTNSDDGSPWVSPVFFAPVGDDHLYWVSAASSRHSRNLTQRPRIAVTIFDSTVAVGHAEAVYFEARAHVASEADISEGLSALNARLPDGKKLSTDDFGPAGAMTLYKADIARRFILVRGGDPEQKNTLDMTLEV